jgi:hypothetical protein
LDAFGFFLKYNDVERAEKSILKREKQKKSDTAYQTSQLALKYAEHGQCQRAQQLLSPLLEGNILFKRTFREHYLHLLGYNIDIILNIFFAKLLCEDSQNALDFLIFYDYSFIKNKYAYTELLQKFAVILNNMNKKELSLRVLKHANDIHDSDKEGIYELPAAYLTYKAIGQEDELAKIIKKRSPNPEVIINYDAQYYLKDDYNSFKNKIEYIYKSPSNNHYPKRLKYAEHFLNNNSNHPDFKNEIERLIHAPFISNTNGSSLNNLLGLYIESHSDDDVWKIIENKGPSYFGINPDAIIPALISKEKFDLLEKYLTKHSKKIIYQFNQKYPRWQNAIAALDSLNYTGNINKIKQYKLTYEIALAIHKNANMFFVLRYLLNNGHTNLAIELQKQQDNEQPEIWIEILEQNMAKLEPQVNFEAELTEEAFLRQFSDYE